MSLDRPIHVLLRRLSISNIAAGYWILDFKDDKDNFLSHVIRTLVLTAVIMIK